MTRPIQSKAPPRRTTCKKCGAPIWRVSVGSWGQSILFNRDGTKPLKGGETQHRCGKDRA